MLVGLLSDTNDRYDVMAGAVRLLVGAGAGFIVHCGDVGNRKVLDPLGGLAAGFVWGDRDKDRMGLLRHADHLGIQCYGVFGDFEVDGKRIAITHGDDTRLLKRLVKEQLYDLILHGHVREALDTTEGNTRIITPGTLDGAKKSVALLDVAGGQVQVLSV